MKRFIKFTVPFIVLIAVLFLLTSPSYAEIKINQDGLKTYGINFKNFRICLLSKDGTLLVGMEKITDLNLIKEKKSYAIHIFRFKFEDNSVISCKTAYLDLNSLEQVILSDEADKLMIVGNLGSQILLLNTNSMAFSTIFKNKKNLPGFRCEIIGMYYKGSFYLKGYLYDAEQFSQGQCFAKVDIKKTGAEAFENVLNMEKLNLPGEIRAIYPFSPGLLYFTVILPNNKGEALIAYLNEKPVEIDKGYKITDIAGAEHRVVYNVINAKGKEVTRIADLEGGKKWDLGSHMPYSFISHHNGNTVIVANINYSTNKMSIYYAKVKDNFKVKPLIEKAMPGSFKLSGDGTVYAYLSTDLKVGKF